MAKKETAKTLERTYNVPLRKEYRKVPRWRKTKKAVDALREFLVKHMKSEDVKLSLELNEHIWKHGIKNPPHHVKVSVVKDEKGVVNADLFGAKEAAAMKTKNKVVKKKEVKTSKLANLKKEVAAKVKQ